MGKELLERIISGDQSAFKELVRKYRHTVFLSALSILHDPDEAEEIAQEVFLKVHLHLSGLRDQNAFERWLRSITCNLAINRLKRRVRRSCIPLDEVASEDLLSPPADEELLRREMVEEVMRAMDELPEGEREILREYLLEEKGYMELSEKYGLSYHAVVMRVKRAKEKVREKVLRRLSGMMMIFPWGKIGKMIGGVVMKATTKVAITGVAVIMLAGAGIWMSHRGEEKPVPESNEMTVERQASVRAPARVALRKPKPKKEKDVITFEEFNRLLDEYFAKEGKEEGNKQEVYPDVKPDVNEGKKQEEPGKETKETTSGTQRTPEQQRLYEILESITWVWDEMNELSHQRADIAKQLSELNKVMPRDPKTGMIDGDWYMKYYYPLEKKMGELDARDRELRKIYYGTLRRYFPEAITESGNQISVDFNKLRKYVGGPLPWDSK
ncbi:RNA polymerase sigma factor [Candidatus Poribacteria bacterium]|nr:RNA polymerase sigma factor [Candidatus Poribacteria bacterium]